MLHKPPRSLQNIQTSILITRASWFCGLFVNVWYLAYYIFQETKCICHFINNISKIDANTVCLSADQTNFSWVYKGRIPLKEVKVKLFIHALPVQLFQTHIWPCQSNVGRELDKFLFSVPIFIQQVGWRFNTIDRGNSDHFNTLY
jgi:hypothetical protein